MCSRTGAARGVPEAAALMAAVRAWRPLWRELGRWDPVGGAMARMYWTEGMTWKEVAGELGVSTRNVYRRRRAMVAWLRDHEEDVAKAVTNAGWQPIGDGGGRPPRGL